LQPPNDHAASGFHLQQRAPGECPGRYRSIDPNTSILPKELLSLEGHMMALRLAQTLGVPTINGNSGMLPDGWHLKEIAFYDEPWDEPLKAWLGKHDRSEVGFIGIIDLDTGEWNEVPLNY
ncbi:MAG: hypothetical protein AAF212_11105, partial [Verrucomicrobiota bacterium]